jgi:hypothetical protein
MSKFQSTHGFDGLAYMGTGFTPAAVYVQPRNPLATDQNGIPLGTFWINQNTNAVFMLIQKLYDTVLKKTIGTWIGISGNFFDSVQTDAGAVIPLNGVLNIYGSTNILTTGVAVNSVYIALNDVIRLPFTNATETEGEIRFGNHRWISNYGTRNTFVGYDSGNVSLDDLIASGNTGIGTRALLSLTDGSFNTSLGHESGKSIDTGTNNIALGVVALTNLTSGSYNIAVGRALEDLVTGSNNIAIGYLAGSAYTGAESSNICIGNVGVLGVSNSIQLGTDGSGVGQQNACYIAGTTHIARNLNLRTSDGTGIYGYIYTGDGIAPSRFISNPGTYNTYVGEDSGSFVIGTAQGNVGVGHEALTTIRDGSGNVAIGDAAGSLVLDNIENVLIGKGAGTALAAGDLNTFVGSRSGQLMNGNAGTIGNTALGHGALGSCVTGSANLCLGGFAGNSLTTNDSNNVLIAHNGIAGHNREIRIGTQFAGGAGDGQQSKCWIAAIRGVTTDVVDAIPVLIDSTGQLGTVSSSERYKENIEDIGPLSDAITLLRPVIFNYKSDRSKTTQYGLIAEEVDEVLPELVIYDKEGLPDTVKYHDLPVLLLNELQKCLATIEQLQERVAKLEKKKKTR